MPEFIIRPMDSAALSAAYQTYIPRHFPANEIRPFDGGVPMPAGDVPMLDVRGLLACGRYAGFGAYDGETLAGYAFFCWDEHGTALLDYLAVMEEYRCHGVGGKLLHYILSGGTSLPWNCLILEVDDPDFANIRLLRTFIAVKLVNIRKNSLFRLKTPLHVRKCAV